MARNSPIVLYLILSSTGALQMLRGFVTLFTCVGVLIMSVPCARALVGVMSVAGAGDVGPAGILFLLEGFVPSGCCKVTVVKRLSLAVVVAHCSAVKHGIIT